MKLESQDFDNKLKSATANLQHMEREVRRTGATFEYADKEETAFLKSLGQMETKAMDAKGKIKELSNSYKELAMLYGRMTDAEKASKPGQALAASLQQLKARLNETKESFANVSKEIGEGGSGGLSKVMETLGSKIGIPASAFTALGGAMAAGAVAAKVAKDAFNANEAAVDDWGRTVEAARSIYDGFLTALNTGDFSGFLSRIGSISEAARKAYDELDRLGTMKTIQSPEMSRQQTENERNRMMLQTRRYIAPLDGSEGMAGMSNGDLLSDAQIKQIEDDLQNGIKRISELVTNEVQQTTNAIEAEYNRQAQTLGMSIEDFKKGTSSMAEFDKMIELAKKYYEFEDAHTTINYSRTGAAIKSRDQAVNPYEGYQKWDVFRVDGEAYNKLVELIKQRDQQIGQAYSLQSQSYRAINRVNGITARGGASEPKSSFNLGSPNDLPEVGSIADFERQASIVRNSMSGATTNEEYKEMEEHLNSILAKIKEIRGEQQKMVTGPSGFSPEGIAAFRSEIQGSMKGMQIGSDEYMFQAERLVDLTSFENLLKSATERGVQPDPALLEKLFETIDNAEFGIKPSVPDEAWDELVDDINEKSKSLPPISLNVKTGGVETLNKEVKQTTDHVAGAAQAFEALGNAMGQIEDPGAKVAGLIANAIASIASGYGQAVAQAGNGSAGGPWGWIAFAIAGLATMISTIAAVKSATAGNYAEGGIIGGNSYSGDNMRGILPNGDIIGLNSGEVVLNAAQQSNLAGQLQSNPMGNLRLSTEISGSNLRVVLNNDNRSRGGSRDVYGVR